VLSHASSSRRRNLPAPCCADENVEVVWSRSADRLTIIYTTLDELDRFCGAVEQVIRKGTL
jgi:hypothetical protein